ncbi:hypothetical protein Q31b_38800 [Novipirellula aureliae]|uniref:Uncharacterized protein n=1 Tax=Novipirellula aureliae TaxID=2527966 RepID=A0A5C6DQA5_9BACT|nr:hypothetical protein Q31b_38800 [Novipirellula aureliae]
MIFRNVSRIATHDTLPAKLGDREKRTPQTAEVVRCHLGIREGGGPHGTPPSFARERLTILTQIPQKYNRRPKGWTPHAAKPLSDTIVLRNWCEV